MVRQDQVGLVADEQPPGDVHAQRHQLIDLLEQRVRIDDDPVADDADDAGVQNSRWNQVEDELLPADVDRVSGVVAALISRDHAKMRRQQVHDFALAFIAPLGAEHTEIHAA